MFQDRQQIGAIALESLAKLAEHDGPSIAGMFETLGAGYILLVDKFVR